MAAFRVPGPLGAGSEDAGHPGSGCVSGFVPGPVEAVGNLEAPVLEAKKTASNPSVPVSAKPLPFAELESHVVNAAAFTTQSKAKAEEGVRLLAIRLLPAGTMLYRIGSTTETDKNYSSPWWMRKSEFDRVLAKGLQDTSWAGRVLLAIATVFGSKCDLQVCVKTAVDLYAWIGEGKALDPKGKAVEDSDSQAYWFPEKDLLQLYIPGLRHQALWERAFADRSIEPWLPIGTQRNVATGKSFIPGSKSSSALPPGKR